MWPLLIGAGVTAAGSLLASRGAKKQAQSELEAARENREFTAGKLTAGQLQQLVAYLGGPEGLARFKAFASREDRERLFGRPAKAGAITDEERARLAEIESEIRGQQNHMGRFGRNVGGDPGKLAALTAERDAIMAKAGGDPGVTGELDESAIAGMGPGLVGEYEALADRYAGENAGTLARYDADSFALDREARDIERGAEKFGEGEAERIKREGDESTANANRLATAALMGRGMGASTSLTEAIGANARQGFNSTQDELAKLKDRQIKLKTGLRAGTLAGMAGRAQGRTGLVLGGQEVDRSLRAGTLNVKQAGLTGSVMNPWLGQNTQQFFPGSSPGGVQAGMLGGALAGAGSGLLGYGLMQSAGGTNTGQGESLEEMRRRMTREAGMGNYY